MVGNSKEQQGDWNVASTLSGTTGPGVHLHLGGAEGGTRLASCRKIKGVCSSAGNSWHHASLRGVKRCRHGPGQRKQSLQAQEDWLAPTKEVSPSGEGQRKTEFDKGSARQEKQTNKKNISYFLHRKKSNIPCQGLWRSQENTKGENVHGNTCLPECEDILRQSLSLRQVRPLGPLPTLLRKKSPHSPFLTLSCQAVAGPRWRRDRGATTLTEFGTFHYYNFWIETVSVAKNETTWLFLIQ